MKQMRVVINDSTGLPPEVSAATRVVGMAVALAADLQRLGLSRWRAALRAPVLIWRAWPPANLGAERRDGSQ